MKHLILGLSLLLSLSACTISRGPAAPLRVSNLQLYSNFQDRHTGAYVICDNYETRLVYSFDYQGYLRSMTTSLIGETSGDEVGPTDVPVTPDFIEILYIIRPGAAPLSAAEELEPNSIVVAPAPGSASKIRFTLRSSGGFTRTYTSDSIPVVSCG
jgi:hypothetical protein